jgi:ankyrin repeat protein
MSIKSILIAGLVVTIFTFPARAQKEAKMNEQFFNAITQGNLSQVKEMLKADPGLACARDQNGLSAILKATYYRKKDIVTALLNAAPDLNIFEAAATGQTDRVRVLIKQDSSLANAYSADGFMPLGLAVFFGHAETVEALLSGGADVNAASREAMKVTPLNSAAAARQTAIARMLLAHGADVNARAVDNFTPLHEAAGNGDLEFAALLLDHKADINAKTRDGKSPLSCALERNRIEMAEFLRKRGAAK